MLDKSLFHFYYIYSGITDFCIKFTQLDILKNSLSCILFTKRKKIKIFLKKVLTIEVMFDILIKRS